MSTFIVETTYIALINPPIFPLVTVTAEFQIERMPVSLHVVVVY